LASPVEPNTSAAPEETAKARAAIDAMVWQDSDGGAPDLQFDTPLAIRVKTARIVEPGTGTPIERGMWVKYNFIAFLGKDHSVRDDTWEHGYPYELMLNESSYDEEFIDALDGQRVGVKLIYGRYADNQATDDAEQSLLTGVMAVEVIAAGMPLTQADGVAVAVSPDLPAVTRSAEGRPSVGFTAGAAPPAELVVQDLISGDGPVIEDDSHVVYPDSEWLWDGEELETSWQSGDPVLSSLVSLPLLPAVIQGIVGKTVGSQVLVVVPPDLAYGDDPEAPVPPNSTVVYVVDLLAKT
jgi:peptidylprolyl isomerase